jgi:hypothetical protein
LRFSVAISASMAAISASAVQAVLNAGANSRSTRRRKAARHNGTRCRNRLRRSRHRLVAPNPATPRVSARSWSRRSALDSIWSSR